MFNVRAALLVIVLTTLTASLLICHGKVSRCIRRYSHFGKTTHTFFIRELFANPTDYLLSQEQRNIYSSYDFESREKNHKADDFGALSVHLIPELEYLKIFKDGCNSGWKWFHEKYPNAKNLIEISLVGFRSNYSEALVYISGGSGCLTGSGNLITLEKKDGHWTVIHELNLWVA